MPERDSYISVIDGGCIPSAIVYTKKNGGQPYYVTNIGKTRHDQTYIVPAVADEQSQETAVIQVNGQPQEADITVGEIIAHGSKALATPPSGAWGQAYIESVSR